MISFMLQLVVGAKIRRQRSADSGVGRSGLGWRMVLFGLSEWIEFSNLCG